MIIRTNVHVHQCEKLRIIQKDNLLNTQMKNVNNTAFWILGMLQAYNMKSCLKKLKRAEWSADVEELEDFVNLRHPVLADQLWRHNIHEILETKVIEVQPSLRK